MKKYLLLIVVLMAGTFMMANATDNKDGILRKSNIPEGTFPIPFSPTGGSTQAPAVSTGYYFVDSDDEASDYWRPNPEIIDTSIDVNLWRRIEAGPRMRDPQYWIDNPSEGLRYFRNPYFPVAGSMFDHTNPRTQDTTDNAIAGPIPIGFGFYFNGLRYDSFYVGSNGIIGLTNRRYTYDGGQRTGYDNMSMDYYARPFTANALTDPNPDDFGFTYAIHGSSAAPNQNQLGGIRTTGGTFGSLSTAHKAAVIAPFFGDLNLSQYNKTSKQPEDEGKVYFKRSNSADKLIVYFINVSPVNALSTNGGTYTMPYDLRAGDNNYVSASAQVVINRLDSSITIQYETFTGMVIYNNVATSAAAIFRYNTTSGVRGFARHVNYQKNLLTGAITFETPWASASVTNAEYEQRTQYYSKLVDPTKVFPRNSMAVKFKQWKNTVRIHSMQYMVRESDPTKNNTGSLDFTKKVTTTEDYEILAGESLIGAIQPVGIIQNLTNDIQGQKGVNFQPQQLQFKAKFRIVNEATNKVVYNRSVNIDSLCLALPQDKYAQVPGGCNSDMTVRIRYSNSAGDSLVFPSGMNGVPSYMFVRVFFPPFEPNEFVSGHIGRLRSYVIADPINPRTGIGYSDEWPFDDTSSTRLFSLRRFTKDERFNDDVSTFHIIGRTPMPSTLKWVNIDAEVQAGDEVSWNPLPPRGKFKETTLIDFKVDTTDQEYTRLWNRMQASEYDSPVIRMNRMTLNNTEPLKSPAEDGDEIRSFPIDLRKRVGAVLTVSFQRTAKQSDWPRGWNDMSLIGPEPRTVVNTDVFMPWTQYGNAVSKYFDQIAVEFAKPSTDGINGITNIVAANWRVHPRRGGASPETKMAAYSLFGGGGNYRGFLESDKDSSLALEDATKRYLNGLRANYFDDGIDYEFRKAFIAIPDTFINSPKEGAKNFRFRVKVWAMNHKLKTGCITCIPDDNDDFFVDNIRILYKAEIADVEVQSAKIIWPYTVVPASQATKVPVRVTVSNNTSVDAPMFTIKAKIFRKNDFDAMYFSLDSNPVKERRSYDSARRELNQYGVYCRVEQLPFLRPGIEIQRPMPSWNARLSGPGKYVLVANIIVPGGDLEPTNDTTYSEFEIKFGDVFAYDNPQSPRNDVPDAAFAGVNGRGLNMYARAEGGTGTVNGPNGYVYPLEWAGGATGGNGSGTIAMRFTLSASDTIYGYQAFFAPLNQAPDAIAYAIYDDQGQPGLIKTGSLMYKDRGWDDKRNDLFYDQYVTVLLKKPMVLPSGTYWLAISQLGETGLELGASKARMGMRTLSIYVPPPITTGGAVGAAGIHLMIDKTFRKTNPNGDFINDNVFAFENTRGSGQWTQFMPSQGNPGYPHLHHYGLTPADNYSTATLSRGTWIPMLRPYLGPRQSFTTANQVCSDDQIRIPVELSYFDGQARNNGVELMWETASEISNHGFYVEKRVGTTEETEWSTIGFVKGAGTSSSVNRYNFTDSKVVNGSAYQYRLRQVDVDGAQSCSSYSKVVTLVFENAPELSLEQNLPNPFNSNTTIAFNLPAKSNVKLEVLDIYGNVINTLTNGELSANRYEYTWNGADMSGKSVVSGTYIYRLTAGNETRTGKMTLVR